ncbi:MAG: hypothetical protein ABGW99_19285 [Zunongwangia sp.]|uniref:hypothetical protein n=1 Tax=Zunongwangia sp. TaxID=1965325 RepID=UPI003241E210
MKVKLLFLFLALTVSTYAQKPAVRIFYGFSDTEISDNEDPNYIYKDEIENFYELGAEITLPLSSKFNLTSGFTYFYTDIINGERLYSERLSREIPGDRYSDNVIINFAYPLPDKQLEILSIPILLEFKFWNYFFLNAGPVLSFELNDPDIEYSQNGIGYHLGFGGQYHFGNFFVFANPYFKQFGTIDFKDETRDHNLNQFGAHVGIGYQF